MRIIRGIKTILALLKELSLLSPADKADYYRSKCEYYQGIIELSLIVASLTSICFIYSDYIINGSVWPTLIPRLSVLLFIAAFFIVTHISNNYRTMIFMDYFLGHGMCIAASWTAYKLLDNSNSITGILIVNIIWLMIGFVSSTTDTIINGIVYVIEVSITHIFNHYSNFEQILALEIPCILGIMFVNYIMSAYYFDHYMVNKKLEKAMVTDPLTQVYNRHLLEQIISDNEIKNTITGDQIAVAMLDIDDFKRINDENGHYTGDLVLVYLGQKLVKATGKDDYVIRYGGEEFVIIMRNCDVSDAHTRLEQFRKEIEEAKDSPIPFTVSVGVSAYTGDYPKTLIVVDEALYEAKNTGKNKVVQK